MSAVLSPEVGHWGGKRRPNLEKILDVVALFMKADLTIPELQELIQPCHGDTPHEYVRLMREAGLLRISEWRCQPRGARWVRVFAWQPTPFCWPDAPKPEDG